MSTNEGYATLDDLDTYYSCVLDQCLEKDLQLFCWEHEVEREQETDDDE